MGPNNNGDTTNKGFVSTSYIIMSDAMAYESEYETDAL